MTRINQIAQAFAAGVAFARSTGLAMDAAEEDKGYWRTIRGHKIHFGPDGKATNAPDWFNPEKVKLPQKPEELIGQNDQKMRAVDKDLKDTAKRLRSSKSIAKLRQTLHAEGLSASEINRVVEARTRIIDALADAQTKNKDLNREINNQLLSGNISLDEARSYRIAAHQTMGTIRSAAEECMRLLRRTDRASDGGKWLKAVQGCQTEAFAGTVELNHIAKQIRGR